MDITIMDIEILIIMLNHRYVEENKGEYKVKQYDNKYKLIFVLPNGNETERMFTKREVMNLDNMYYYLQGILAK